MAGKKKKSGAKKKGGDDSGGAGERESAPDQFDQMDSDQLKMAIVDMTSRLKDIKNQRVSQQIERDQVQQFLDIAHDEVIKKEAALEHIEHNMEVKQETHLNDIRWYMSKVTHLELDHQNALKSVADENECNIKAEMLRSTERKEQLKKQRAELQAKLVEDGAASEQSIKNQLGLQQKEIRKLNQEFERQSNQLASRYQTKMAQLKDDLELQTKMEIHEIEERKNLHINDLMQNHEKSFNEMRDYYNSITRDNLALISSLKEELVELKAKAAVNERTIDEIAQENRKLSEPLSRTEIELKDLKAKLSNYMKEKRSLKLAKNRVSQMDSQLKREQIKMEEMSKSFQEVEADRDRLYAQFESIIREVQSKSGAKTNELEKDVDKFIERFARKSTQFTEVLSAANLDQTVVTELTNKLDAVLDSKNAHIKQLSLQIAKLSKAHDNLIRIYNAKLPELGVPINDIAMPLLSDQRLDNPQPGQ